MNESSLSKDDRQQLLQTTIDLDLLEKYYHAELPGRKPLLVLKNTIVTDDLVLKKFGAPVRYVSKAELKQGLPFLEIENLEIQGSGAASEGIVRFAYAIEGIRGTAKFTKKDGSWRLESRQLSER